VYGAVPGALPPVTGWVAATGDFGLGAWILFSIVFLWQLPHSLAIAKLYVDDYERAGFRMLPVVDRAGRSTERQILSNCVALLAVGLSPSLFGLTGSLYFVSALILGCGLLLCGISLARSRTAASARRLLFASLIYLPLLLAFMAIDKA
jgi:protoheme IX farnesyltransferase